MKTRTSAAAGLALLVVLALNACSSSRSGIASATSSGGSTVTTTPGTTAPAPTTAPASTAPATTVPAVDPFLLRSDGVGAADFGDDVATVQAALGALGGLTTDETGEFPTPDGAQYVDAAGENVFVAPYLRTLCWSNSLCAHFGGATPTTVVFVGWAYTDDASATMHTASGATLGIRGSAVTGLNVNEGGCYTSGMGDVDGGIQVSLYSDGVPFMENDGTTAHRPPAADVTIISLYAGEMPLFLYGDC